MLESNNQSSLTKFAATRQIEHVHEGHHKNGIVAYTIQPGGVNTDLTGKIPEGKGWEARKYIFFPSFSFSDKIQKRPQKKKKNPTQVMPFLSTLSHFYLHLPQP